MDLSFSTNLKSFQMGRADTEILLRNSWRFTPGRLAEHLHGEFKRFPYIEFLSNKICKTIMNGNGRLIVSMPPRVGKSTLISKWVPVWYLSLFNAGKVILTSYDSTFASQWGRVVRNVIDENSELLEIKVCSDSHAADRWELLSGGTMYCTGIGGPITGRGGNLLIIDDPVKNWQEAMSEAVRQNHIDWFNSTFYTRCEPNASIILLMTRWHEGDLAGYLMDSHSDKWDVVKFPALAEENDPMGRPVGAALNPERFDEAVLANVRAAIGTRAWNGLYQQRPSAAEGNIFKREWWKFYNEQIWDFDQVISSWDMTFKDSKESDYVVGTTWGRRDSEFYLLDMVRKQMAFTESLESVRQTFNKWEPQATLIETAANGEAILDTLESEIPGILGVKPEGSKEARAQSISPLMESGQVYLPDMDQNPWVQEFVEEFANFPNARFDDIVDSTSMALRYLRQMIIDFIPGTENVRSIDR
jgi:predicted phage terminase large subunit-like protein